MKNILTLTVIIKDQQILLGLKKRGFGVGRLNGFGGKVDKEESIEEAAIREVFEETSLQLKSIEKIGLLNFSWQNKPDILEVHLFHSDNFKGEPQESEEMKPAWYSIKQIPYKKMWDDDKYWLPLFLSGQKFNAHFKFDKHDKVIDKKIDLTQP